MRSNSRRHSAAAAASPASVMSLMSMSCGREVKENCTVLYCTVLYCTVLYLRQGGEGDLQPADRVLVRVLLLGRVAEVHRGVRSLQIFLFVVKIFFRRQNCPCLLALKVGGESLGLAGVELDYHGGSGHPCGCRVRAEKAEME